MDRVGHPTGRPGDPKGEVCPTLASGGDRSGQPGRPRGRLVGDVGVKEHYQVHSSHGRCAVIDPFNKHPQGQRTASDMTLVTGDLVRSECYWPQKTGIVVGVMPSNNDNRMVFPNVYYVYFSNKGVIGPLFGSELRLC